MSVSHCGRLSPTALARVQVRSKDPGPARYRRQSPISWPSYRRLQSRKGTRQGSKPFGIGGMLKKAKVNAGLAWSRAKATASACTQLSPFPQAWPGSSLPIELSEAHIQHGELPFRISSNLDIPEFWRRNPASCAPGAETVVHFTLELSSWSLSWSHMLRHNGRRQASVTFNAISVSGEQLARLEVDPIVHYPCQRPRVRRGQRLRQLHFDSSLRPDSAEERLHRKRKAR